MVKTQTLKQIDFMKDLPEPILERIAALAKEEEVQPGVVLQRQGVEQEMVYMLLSGKVSLNCRNSAGETLTLDALEPGQTFGISGLLGRENSESTFTAVSEECCTFLELSAAEMLDYFHSDYEVGHVLMDRVVNIYKNRRKLHSEQFTDSLAHHPAIASPGDS
ncbi:MAG: cyclic nucleotide-binding domain-containing protein [Desulfobacterales bacterium]|nr:cyclic nucleotide-binding domain-containing protein [Desulfobacterales bacterium]